MLDVEVLGHRAELVDRVVALRVHAIEQRAAPHRIEDVGAVHDRVETRVAALVRLERTRTRDRAELIGVLLHAGDLLLRPIDLVLQRVVRRLRVLVAIGSRVRGPARRGDTRFGVGHGVAGRPDRLRREQQQRERDQDDESAALRRTRGHDPHEQRRS